MAKAFHLLASAKLRLLFLVLAASVLACAQSGVPSVVTGNGYPQIVTVSGLSTIAKQKGMPAIVTDGNSASDCTTGGGSNVVFCGWNGSAWAALGGGGGSGTVSNSAGAGNAYYAGAGTTVSADTNIVDSGSGGLTFSAGVTHITSTQGTLGAGGPFTSAPFISHTATWNTTSAITDFLTNITCTAAATGSSGFQWQVGGNALFQLTFGASNCGTPNFDFASGATPTVRVAPGTGVKLSNGNALLWSSAANVTTSADTCLDRGAAKTVRVDGNSACNDGLGTLQYGLLTSTGNCAAVGTAASPSVASCSASPAGSFSCATNASGATCQVNTTAVTANSTILITQRTDTTTGTRLGVTCNTTVSSVIPVVTAVTAATSFTINLGTITTNPECFSYQVIN